jgi:hypothetical protein
MAWSLFALGRMAMQEGNPDEARRCQERAKSLLQEKQEKASLAHMKFHSGIEAACRDNDYDRANTLYAEALALYKEVKNHRGIAQTLMIMDGMSGPSRPPAERRVALLSEAIIASREAGIREWEASCYTSLIEIAQEQGDTARVAALQAESAHLEAEMKEEAAQREEIAKLEQLWEEEQASSHGEEGDGASCR